MKVVGYLCVSTGAQVAGNGLDAQRDAIHAEAAQRGWDVTWVEDPGASARAWSAPASSTRWSCCARASPRPLSSPSSTA